MVKKSGKYQYILSLVTGKETTMINQLDMFMWMLQPEKVKNYTATFFMTFTATFLTITPEQKDG